MKENELRIGNWVLSPTEGEVQIENGWQIDEGEEVEPIPLTEEWLVKFGFGFRQDDISKMFHVGENPLTYDWLFCVTWIDGYQFPFYKNGYHEIKHVHQLQNLFYSLCGEELTQ